MPIASFENLVDQLKMRLQQPLPGAAAHEIMRATPVGKIIPSFEHKAKPKPGSVLILLYPDNSNVYFPLIQRPIYTGTHSGQISLPGGKAEAGEDAISTALREGQEEIGIDPNSVSIIGRLSDFFVIPSNFLVSPILAFTTARPAWIPDKKEVEKIILGNIQDLLQKDAIKTKEITTAGRFQLLAPHFEIESQIIWGATAMMLNEFRTILLSLYDR